VNKNEQQSLLFPLTNWVLFLTGLANLAIGTWAAMHSNTAVAGVCLAAGLVLLLAGNIDRFESLKGLGMEAKTRKLERTISEATDVLTRLRELGELTGESLLTLQSTVGRVPGAPTPAYAYETAQKIRSSLVAVGSSDAAIKAVMSSWVKTFTADMAAAVFAPIKKEVDAHLESLRTELGVANVTGDRGLVEQLYPRFQAVSRYVDQCENIRTLATRDPLEFLKHVEDAPVRDVAVIAQDVGQIRLHVAEMQQLSANFELVEPEGWFHAIDESRRT